MIFFPVVNEACRVYAEGIAVKAADLDIAGVMGMGFPPYRSHKSYLKKINNFFHQYMISYICV